MAKEKELKSNNGCQCSGGCVCGSQNPVLMGFKKGFGFWLSGLLVWLLVSAVVALLYYFL